MTVDVLDGNQMGRVKFGGCAAVESERMVLFFDQIGIAAGNEFECVVGARGPGKTQPDLTESATPKEADELVAVELAAGGQCLWARGHARTQLADHGWPGKGGVLRGAAGAGEVPDR